MLNFLEQFEHVEDLSWNDVLEIWRNQEENLEHWIKYYQEKGFNSWEEFRIGTINSLKLDRKKWALYRINNPLSAVPNFYGGPFKTWREKYYEGRNFVTFSEITQQPEIKNHPTINEMQDNFPEKAEFIGLIIDDGVVIVEGMHRCCAITLAAKNGKTLDADIFIVLAQSSTKELTEVINRSKK